MGRNFCNFTSMQCVYQFDLMQRSSSFTSVRILWSLLSCMNTTTYRFFWSLSHFCFIKSILKEVILCNRSYVHKDFWSLKLFNIDQFFNFYMLSIVYSYQHVFISFDNKSTPFYYVTSHILKKLTVLLNEIAFTD